MFDCELEDWSHLIDSNTKLVIDCDGILFKAASIAEKRKIKVTNKITKEQQVFDNRTEFWGRTKKTIGSGSYLYNLNLERESEGLELYTKEDFTIEDTQEVHMSIQMCQKLVTDHLALIRDHVGVDNLVLLAGDKDNFRLKLPLPEPYKGNREGTARPLLLKELTTWFKDKLVTHPTPYGIEADDYLTMFGFKGYLNYIKTGKYSYIVATNDKDQKITPCLLLDWTKEKAELVRKNMYHIEATDKSVGQIKMVKNEVKGVGLKYLAYQITVHDNADHYGAIKFFNHASYGDKTFFLDFNPLKTPKDILQKVVDKYQEWFPDGVKYKSWCGKDMELTWLEYAELQFQCAYMKRTLNDKTTLEDLLKRFNVTY